MKEMQNKSTQNEKLFSTRLSYWYNWYLSEQGTVHYAMYSILYINTLNKNTFNYMGNSYIVQKYIPMQLEFFQKVIYVYNFFPSIKMLETVGEVM